MPGGFHPFHAGHAALYNSAKRAFPDAEVFVAATNDTSSRPFPFAVKEKLAKLAGVEPGHFVQVKSPFQAKEITSRFNPEQDHLIFVRSEKDADKPPLAGGVKKDGNPSYLQPLLGATRLEPFSKRAYMAYLPTVEFGPGMTSATEIRTAWPTLNEKRKTALVMSLYPGTQKNPKLASNVVAMLDTAIGSELEESKMIDSKMIDVFYRPDPHSRARRVVAKNIPATILDRLLEKLSDKFAVPATSFEWQASEPIDEDQNNDNSIENIREVLANYEKQDQAASLNPPSRQALQKEAWPFIKDNLATIMSDKGVKGDGGPGTAAMNAWVIVQHMDAFPAAQKQFADALAQAIPNHPKLKFIQDRAAVNEKILQLAGTSKYLDKNGQPLTDPTSDVRDPSKFDDAGEFPAINGGKTFTSQSDALNGAKQAKNLLLYKAVIQSKATTQPSFRQDVAEMDGQNFVGGMTASYQARDNQPVAEDYVQEKRS